MEQGDGGSTHACLAHQAACRRRRAGMAMHQLAEASGVTRRMLSLIELGGAHPSLASVNPIASALRTDFASLVRGPRTDSVVSNAPGTVPGNWLSDRVGRTNLQMAGALHPPAETWDWALAPGDTYHAEPDPPESEELFPVT